MTAIRMATHASVFDFQDEGWCGRPTMPTIERGYGVHKRRKGETNCLEN